MNDDVRRFASLLGRSALLNLLGIPFVLGGVYALLPEMARAFAEALSGKLSPFTVATLPAPLLTMVVGTALQLIGYRRLMAALDELEGGVWRWRAKEMLRLFYGLPLLLAATVVLSLPALALLVVGYVSLSSTFVNLADEFDSKELYAAATLFALSPPFLFLPSLIAWALVYMASKRLGLP
ncbi:MAG: hypothetical protein ABWK00_05710 [Desulfurococcaceae archaeon]